MRTAESETETGIARREATRRAERRRRAKSVLTRKGEGGNCDYRARVTETVEARRITGEDACGASGGHHRYVEGDEE